MNRSFCRDGRSGGGLADVVMEGDIAERFGKYVREWWANVKRNCLGIVPYDRKEKKEGHKKPFIWFRRLSNS